MALKRKTRIHVLVWVVLILIVVMTGMVFLPREYPRLGYWETLYDTLRLFILERDFEPFPTSWPVVAICFLAPLITLSVMGTVVSYLFRVTPTLRTLWKRDHVVVCGVGRTGKLLCSALKEKGLRVVGVDLGPHEAFEEWLAESKVPMVYGDLNSRAVLEKARAHHARSVVFATGDDLINLEAAARAHEWLRVRSEHRPMIWTHVANERLTETARSILSPSGSEAIRFFDTYRIAATRMVLKHFPQERRSVKTVVILGFGKFGRDLFEVLVRDLVQEEHFDIQVIDKQDREQAVLELARALGIEGRVAFRQANLHDLEPEVGEGRAFFLCTDDDMGNITMAMLLAERTGAAQIFVRMAHWPIAAVAERLGEDKGVVFVNIHDLVMLGIRRLPGILERGFNEDRMNRLLTSSPGIPAPVRGSGEDAK